MNTRAEKCSIVTTFQFSGVFNKNEDVNGHSKSLINLNAD